MFKKILATLFFMLVLNTAFACPQKKPVQITKQLIQKLASIPRDSSNANQIEKMIGSACACLPSGNAPSETWTCQWKGDLKSNRLENTINVFFESGMISGIVWINSKGDFIRPFNPEVQQWI